MIKNFKIYEMFDNFSNDYIISIPSGEVIYMDKDTALYLSKLQYVHFDLDTERFICKDDYVPQILDYIYRRKTDKKNDFDYEKKKIIILLHEWGIEDQYDIREDLSVDVFSSINMSHEGLTFIPVKFNRCTSDFNCSHNNLLSLKNAPVSVHGNFNCSYNQLVSLEMGPNLVSRVYNCSHNKLKTLKGCPHLLNDFNCSYNFLKDLNHAPIVRKNFIKNNNLFDEL